MTLLSELIDIPEQVHSADFVISLATAVGHPPETVRNYVVTEQLVGCFDRSLSLIATAVAEGRSKATYLHASFGAGKTAMMAMLHLLLQGDPSARSVPALGEVIAKYATTIDGRRFLLVPNHFVGKSSMEQEVLGGYVEHIRKLHPDAPLPAVYVADGILDDARTKRTELGDDAFFRVLSEGAVADEWGDYGAGWDPARFDRAIDAGPGSSERDQLVSALLRTHYRAVPGQAHATAEGFVPLSAGLGVISRHAKGLGYDAVVLFLDELVLWLASRMGDAAFVSREGEKVAQLVEADAAERPAPIVSFVARQRDLRELVGDHVPGAQSLSAIDVLRYSEGRFDTITLEDRNLPVIAAKRILRPRSEQARQQLDDAFERVRRELDERREQDVLLTATGDLADFRRLYPFSPALVDALVALSGAMQRERTALKVMLQLLVDGRDRLEVGQLIPLGDLWDAITSGDEPLTEVMRAQLAQARRLWSQTFFPVLLRQHGLSEDQASGLSPTHPFVADARLVKSLLVAALVPEVGALRHLTVSRLTALNAGVVRAFIPGTERQQVLERLRRWAAEVGELRLGGDEQDPTVSVELSGIDTRSILEAGRRVDSDGERRRKLRELLDAVLEVRDPGSFEPSTEVEWRGTRRRVALVFGNVRDRTEVPDEALRSGTDPKVVIDFPWDADGFSPHDDRSRVDEHRHDRAAEWTAVWLPNFFTEATRKALGDLVVLDHVLGSGSFDQYAAHLSANDRLAARSQLQSQRAALQEQLNAALRQAFGVDRTADDKVEEGLSPAEQFCSLDPGLIMQPPVGTSLRDALVDLAGQLFRHRYPRHPEFAEMVTRADLVHTLDLVGRALQEPNARLENVEPPLRKVLARVAGPLELGTMYQAHFVADVRRWVDLVERRRVEAGVTSPAVGEVRRWLDGADSASDRRGLTREVGDLLVLVVVAATQRSVVAAGQPIGRPEIGKLRDEWELRPQELPSESAWQEALSRASQMGVVASSSLLSGVAVADLTQRLHDRLVDGHADVVRELVTRLEEAASRVGVATDSDRLRTARAAAALVDAIARQPDRAVDALAAASVPTTPAALGTSIAQARAVADELGRTNWALLRAVGDLADPWQTPAMALADRLREALIADELAVGLVPRLRDAIQAATDLMSQAAATHPRTSGSDGATSGAGASASASAPAPGGVSVRDPAPALDRSAAERQLEDLRRRLREEAGLDLRWEIVAMADGRVDG